jgi:hypothetical protein
MADAALFCGPWKNRASAVPPLISYDAASDTWRNSNNCVFRQLPQELPALAPFYSSAELSFNSLPYVNWAYENGAVAVAICTAYLAFVFLAPALLRRAGVQPLRLKGLLAAWNLLLAAFSAVGFLRTAPHLAFYAAKHGLYSSICAPAETSFGQGAAGLWTMLFIFSKVPELIDTVFLVLAQKPVIFLHWYHHFTVLLYCERGREEGRAQRALSPDMPQSQVLQPLRLLPTPHLLALFPSPLLSRLAFLWHSLQCRPLLCGHELWSARPDVLLLLPHSSGHQGALGPAGHCAADLPDVRGHGHLRCSVLVSEQGEPAPPQKC